MNRALKPGPAPEPKQAAGLPGAAQTVLSGPETPVFPRSAFQAAGGGNGAQRL